MCIIVCIVVIGAMWLDYDIRNPNGRWYDLFH